MHEITIKNLEIYGHHGVFDSEKQNGQMFVIDINIWCDSKSIKLTDELDDTIDYSAVCNLVNEYMTKTIRNTIEKVAYEISNEILDKFPKCKKIRLTVKKPMAPMDYKFEYVATTIEMERQK